MSTILDSLKKSSNQRSGLEKQSIDNFNFSGGNKSSKTKLFLVVILLLLILGVGSYWLYNNYFLKTKEEQEQSLVKKEQTQETKQISKQAVDPTKKTKPNSKKVKERILAIQKKRRQEKIKKEQRLAQKKKQSQPKAISELNKKIKPPTKTKQIAKQLPKLVLPKAKPKPVKAPVKSPAKTSQKEINYKYVYQLPFSIRKDIPKFKLNIHVYDENPENRLAIINGVEYTIDELIDDQVLVKDIVREGVVLEFNNHVFLIPKL